MDNSQFLYHSNKKNLFASHQNLIRFAMTEEEFKAAVESAQWGDVTSNSQIIVHEYAHWMQSVGTPYGYHYELVSYYEKELLRKMEEKIAARLYRHNGLRVSPPFSQYISNPIYSNIHDRELLKIFEQWVDLLYYQKFATSKRNDYYEMVKASNDFFAQYPECETFSSVDNYIFPPMLFSRVDEYLRDRILQEMGQKNTPHTLTMKDCMTKENWKAYLATGMNAYSVNITPSSLWESYATVVEYIDIPDKFQYIGDSDQAGRGHVFNEYYDPLKLLEQYLSYAIQDKRLFLQTCNCLFDVVFSLPVLPQCLPLRAGETISMFDFDFVSRFYAVGEAAGHLPPLNQFQSLGEYEAAVCKILGWHTPDEIYAQIYRCWDSLNVIYRGKMLQQFVDMRISGEYLSFNRSRFLEEIFYSNLIPCYLEFSDKTVTNTKLEYGLTTEGLFTLQESSIMYLGMSPMLPEPLENNYTFYRQELFEQLVEKLWENKDKNIVLSIHEDGSQYVVKLEKCLSKWLEENHIDAQVKVRT